MPYKKNETLPKNVKDALPKGAQTIYRKAYNNAYEQYKESRKRKGNASREETSHKVAWSAVKKEYRKKGDKWVKKKN